MEYGTRNIELPSLQIHLQQKMSQQHSHRALVYVCFFPFPTTGSFLGVKKHCEIHILQTVSLQQKQHQPTNGKASAWWNCKLQGGQL